MPERIAGRRDSVELLSNDEGIEHSVGLGELPPAPAISERIDDGRNRR
jgi:hypothetical protein